jgi:hypothetical protein
METRAWSEGQDGAHPVYRERLWPPVPVVILVIALAVLIGVAYGAAYGSAWGWGAGLVLGLLGLAALALTSPVVRVDDRVVRAGRARLPLASISDVQELDADAMRHARRHGDPRDYLVLRAWSSRTGVAIGLDDPRDPHPRWVVTTRHPARLAEAVAAARADAAPR